MARKLYVGNLGAAVSDRQLSDLFAPHGDVVDATVIRDRQTGQSRRFGFVVLATEEQAQLAMTALDGTRFSGKDIRVSPARERPQPAETNQRLRLRLPFRLVSSRPRQPGED